MGGLDWKVELPNGFNRKRLKVFEELYGNKPHPQTQNSWYWKISGERAMVLADAIEPFAPSRAAIVADFRQCMEPNISYEDKLLILRESKGRQRLLDLPVERYVELISDPEFVAGVFDGRSVVWPYEKYDKRGDIPYGTIYPEIDFHSPQQSSF